MGAAVCLVRTLAGPRALIMALVLVSAYLVFAFLGSLVGKGVEMGGTLAPRLSPATTKGVLRCPVFYLPINAFNIFSN